MAKMLVLYKTPPDIMAFERHYQDVHIPLAGRLPGLLKYEINAGGIRTIAGQEDVYKIAILYFESMETLKSAFDSEIGRQCAADRRLLATDEAVQLFIFDSKDVF